MNKKTYLIIMLELREKLYQYYVAYEKVAKWFFRFLGTLILFFSVAAQFGYEDKLTKPLILLGASVVGAFVTDSIRVFLVFLYTVVQIYFLSPVLAAGVLLAGGILFFLLLHYDHDTVLAAAFIPVFLWCKIPCFLVIILGLFFTPASLLSAISGAIFYYVLQSVKLCENMAGAKTTELFELIKQVGDSIIYNRELYVVSAMLCIVLLVTWLFRKSKISYSFELGIVFGTVSSIVVLFMGNLFAECDFSMGFIIAGSLLSGVLAYVVHFFHMALDYGAIEEVQFEDDDYFYYVRAVPKMKMTVGEKTVKHIYTNKEHIEKKKDAHTTKEKVELEHKMASVAKQTPQSGSTRTEQRQQDKEQVVPVVSQDEKPAAGMQQPQNGDTVSDERKEMDTENAVHTQQTRNTRNRKRAQHSKHKNRKKAKRKR